ncbi:hypothetical protein C6P46_006715 [Rhodotorula mucilaginosa]|uniref:HIG1 domain-containing protein n=1 Tax=Rhodotorula mucilaginosa TaxID=5537 RepID=A0A9P7B360_RHOMI|nr:hypothetical protein C6P46_006715 [Rhodotorula mucilaginosa]
MLNPLGSSRTRHGAEDEDIAYRLQVMGAREGAIKGTVVGATLMALANWRFPWVQRQTLAGKSFLVMWATIFGMVTHADHYLLKWEQEHRVQSERWRTAARSELAAQGTVPSESAMRAWKANYDAKVRATIDSPVLATQDAPSQAAASSQEGRSAVLEELELAKQDK